MRVKWEGIKKDNNKYAIILGKILEVKHSTNIQKLYNLTNTQTNLLTQL